MSQHDRLKNKGHLTPFSQPVHLLELKFHRVMRIIGKNGSQV